MCPTGLAFAAQAVREVGLGRMAGMTSLVAWARDETAVPGVFAACDITPGPQLAIRAAAGGAVAAMAMHKSLVPEHRKPGDG